LAQIKAPADDELTLAEDLRLPAPGLPVKAELATPCHVVVPEAPDRLTWLRDRRASPGQSLSGVTSEC